MSCRNLSVHTEKKDPRQLRGGARACSEALKGARAAVRIARQFTLALSHAFSAPDPSFRKIVCVFPTSYWDFDTNTCKCALARSAMTSRDIRGSVHSRRSYRAALLALLQRWTGELAQGAGPKLTLLQ